MARILAGRDTIAPGAPGASRRNTPYDRGVMGEESTIEIACADVDAFATAYRLITECSPAYRALVRQAQTAPDDETPAGFCARAAR